MHFSPKDVARLTGLRSTQIAAWRRQRLIEPSAYDSGLQGTASVFSRQDVIALKVVTVLRRHGVSVAQLRPVVRAIQGADEHEVGSMRLLVMPGQLCRVFDPEEFIDSIDVPGAILVDVGRACAESISTRRKEPQNV